MGKLYELNGLIYQIEDKESRERAFEIVAELESHFKRNNRKAKTLCDCLDWRDASPSPFCKKCNGTGSY